MSVVTALSYVLVVGFIGTGLVGFVGWLSRMREGARVSARINARRDQTDKLTRLRRINKHAPQGVRL
jgi:hypothetical protein